MAPLAFKPLEYPFKSPEGPLSDVKNARARAGVLAAQRAATTPQRAAGRQSRWAGGQAGASGLAGWSARVVCLLYYFEVEQTTTGSSPSGIVFSWPPQPALFFSPIQASM